MSERIRSRRSLLFVPAVRPDRFPKALAAGPDVVCLDLEDAVPPGDKARAREAALSLLAREAGDGVERLVRVNSLRSADGLRDMLALIEGPPPDGILLPKVAGADEIRWAADLTAPEIGLHVLIETAEGLEHARAIAGATSRLRSLLLGAVDLAAELGCGLDRDALHYARSRVVHAAAGHGLDAIDVPHLTLDDEAGLREECRAVQGLGFTGKAAIHPRQVPVIHEAFTPDAETVAEARRIVEAFEGAVGGVAVLDGKLVELPVVRRMRRILALGAAAAR